MHGCLSSAYTEPSDRSNLFLFLFIGGRGPEDVHEKGFLVGVGVLSIVDFKGLIPFFRIGIWPFGKVLSVEAVMLLKLESFVFVKMDKVNAWENFLGVCESNRYHKKYFA